MINVKRWWNNGLINKRNVDSPGEDFILGRINFKRCAHSDITKLKISKSLKGRDAWNKGLINIYSEETLKLMSEKKKGIIPWNKGKKLKYNVWNKGLDYNDIRVKKYVDSQRGQKRKGNYLKPEKWKGVDNPWYGKNRSGENSPKFKGYLHNREYRNYVNKVYWLTEKNYRLYKDIINPNNKVRTLSGVNDGYQLDHIFSVYKGYLNNIKPEEVAKVDNLQMLSWKDNRIKWYM